MPNKSELIQNDCCKQVEVVLHRKPRNITSTTTNLTQIEFSQNILLEKHTASKQIYVSGGAT